MKKVLLLLALALSTLATAQTETQTDSVKKVEIEAELYFGFGLASQSQYNLNDKLANSALPTIVLNVPEFIVGWNVMQDKFALDSEFGFYGGRNDQGDNRTQIMGFNFRLRPHYNIVNKEKFAFSAGLNLGYTANQVDIFSRTASIDLNNINNTNTLTLRNSMWFAGPSVSLYLFKHKTFSPRINLGYELALTRGRWKSDFSAIQNTIGESGNNRFIFGISLL